ncbi:MAG: hypothetical protein IKJ89_02250, partial [Kiritimatiellae bacterium]|nr:hypothetical protein [Kiritimatiellia bacterium]
AQLKSLADERFLIENKPYLPIDDLPRRLVGSTPDEIRSVLAATGCGFCLDIGHAVASANAHGANWRVWLADFFRFVRRCSTFRISSLIPESISTFISAPAHFRLQKWFPSFVATPVSPSRPSAIRPTTSMISQRTLNA